MHDVIERPQQVIKTEILYSVLSKEHIESATECLAEAFLDEPLLKHLGLSYELLFDFLKPRVVNTAKDGLSVVAIENNVVVSAILCDDFSEDEVPYDNQDKWQSQIDPVFEVLSDLHKHSLEEQKMHADGLLFYHLFFGGTRMSSRRQGHLRKLIDMTFAIAREKEFDVMVVEASSIGTQKSCREYGFQFSNTIQYSDYPHPLIHGLEGEKIELFLKRI